MSKVVEMTGQTFGKLTVLSRADSKRGRATWLCRCDCGTEIVVTGHDLRCGDVKSCGCLQQETRSLTGKANARHHESGTRLYNVWTAMKKRCLSECCDAYSQYGARGITVCHEWENSFEAFRNWALANGYRDNLTLDRIDNDGPYSPENCRWATYKVQNNNTRKNRLITYQERTQTLAQWAEEFGMQIGTLHRRLERGWNIEKALTAPIQKKG